MWTRAPWKARDRAAEDQEDAGGPRRVRRAWRKRDKKTRQYP